MFGIDLFFTTLKAMCAVSADEVDKRANRWDWTPRRYIDAAVEHLREQQEEAKAAYQLTEKDAETLQVNKTRSQALAELQSDRP
jgi:hypothetical protein